MTQINPCLPVILTAGYHAKILEVREDNPDNCTIIGAYNDGNHWQITKWDGFGRNIYDDTLDIKNPEEARQITVYTAIYDDDTTGFGYPKRELAEKYARSDKQHAAIIDIKKLTILINQSDKQ